ncbi:MAG: Crp/Fnr family transcriptional regulator [Anaerolineae bacterium]|nr:Crp/Fnr family transcriptional regulator [Anaerolineae bacterium]
MRADPTILAELSLFRDLPKKQLDMLAGQVRCRVFQSGTNIMLSEQPGEVVYFVLSGTLKIYIEQANGTEVILAILGRGDTVGEMSLIDSAGRSASVLTLEETTLLWMDGSAFQQALRSNIEMALNLVRILSARVRLNNELIQALAALDVNGRVARQLLAFADRYGEEGSNGCIQIPIRLTQKDIADLVGASRKRVNQVMVMFKNQGLISVDGEGQVTIHERVGLARYCR